MLAGVSKIFVGWHQSGKLQRTETLLVEDMGPYNLQGRLDWAYQVLSSIRAFCLQGDAGKSGHRVWRVRVGGPTHGIEVRELDGAEVKTLNRDDERVGILPAWYVDELHELELSVRMEKV